MADVSKIKLPNGTTYNLKDTVSGYTKNTGTITKIQTTAGAHTTINVSSGAAAFNVPTKTSHLTNDSGFITSADIPSLLTGTTATVTPTQVVNALANNQNVEISHTDSTYGSFKFYDFICSPSQRILMSSAIIKWYNNWLVFELIGNVSTDMWTTLSDTVALASDIVDEKLKTYNNYRTNGDLYYLVFGNNTNNAETKYHSTGLSYLEYLVDTEHFAELRLGKEGLNGQLSIHDGSNNAYRMVTIKPTTLTQQQILTLPNKTGTVALTSDIPAPLIGSTSTITPTQVYEALQEGRDVVITHEDVDYGSVKAYHFNYSASLNIVVSSSLFSYIGWRSISLLGELETNDWTLSSTVLARLDSIPTKTSDLTNDSGFITIDTNTTYSLSGALSSHKFTSTLTASGTTTGTSTSDFTLAAGTGITITDNTSTRTMTIATNLTIPTKMSELTNDSGFITSETDPIFSASAAAGITATDINNWNAKVSDDKTWNGVGLATTTYNSTSLYYVTAKNSTTLSGDAGWIKTNTSPTNYAIARWNGSGYLLSTTPSANDNSTKVATTAYVDSALSGYVPVGDFSAEYIPVSFTNDTIAFPNMGTTYTLGNPVVQEALETIIGGVDDLAGMVAYDADIPTITLNGSNTTSPSFYAPTTAGTSGYFLQSNGSGAPTWTQVEYPTIHQSTNDPTSTDGEDGDIWIKYTV